MTDRLNPEALDQQALEAACKTLWESAANYPRLWEDVSPAVQEGSRRTVRKSTAAYLAALPAPRTVTTVEELDAMPAETVIKAADGNVYEQNTLDPRLSAQWVATGSKYPVVPECVELPALVLWVPTEGGGE